MPVGTIDQPATETPDAPAEPTRAKAEPRMYCIYTPGPAEGDLCYLGTASGLTKEAAMETLLDEIGGDHGDEYIPIAARYVGSQKLVTNTKVTRSWK